MPDFRDKDELRVGTKEREATVEVLGTHLADGRLSLDEYDERMTAAIAAKTLADLRALFADLPAPYPDFMAPPPPRLPDYPPPRPVPVLASYSMTPVPMEPSDRNSIVAGVLQLCLPFGIGRFYTGHTSIGLAQLLTVFIGIGVIWSMIDGIILLASGGTDVYGRQLRR